MEPAVHDGDRRLVAGTRKTPSTGEMAVLRDGGGLAVKRAGSLPRTDPVPGRPVSANPACEPCTCLADEARIAGTVIQALGRV